MRPVDQTAFDAARGDCLRACIATITGVPLEQVPHFCAVDDWYGAFAEWLQLHGYAPLSMSFPDGESFIEHMTWAQRYGARVPWIAGGSVEHGRHFVVFLGDRLFHDPDPRFGRRGLLTIHDATFLLRAAA